MKKKLLTVISCFSIFILLSACGKKDVSVEDAPVTEQTPVEQPATATTARPIMLSGNVLETMTTAGYTYVLVDDGSQQVWAAAPAFEVSEGDTVNVPPGQAMPDYHSTSLDKTFDVVYFVPAISVGDAPLASTAPGGHPAPTVTASDISFDGLEKAEGGLTVAELFRDRESLAGKEVAVRGKVVKFSPQIMGTNWIHLQDGTDHNGSNDLTVTSSAQAEKGNTILVTGVVTVDKDFGAGYSYSLIIENAQVAVE